MKDLIKRVFWIEPNLVKNTGHVIEGTSAIRNYVGKFPHLKLVVVTNKDVRAEVKEIVGDVSPMITSTSFQDLEDEGKAFNEDLLNIRHTLQFTLNDLVIIPTCFTNEIEGVAKFLKNLRWKVNISLVLHQILPPVPEFNQTLTKEFQEKWKQNLTESLNMLKIFKDFVSVWTTESKLLSGFVNSIVSFKVGRLPLPINFYPGLIKNQVDRKSEDLTISFLGDGRYEKGLLLLMETIASRKPQQNIHFVLQEIDARGYSPKELRRFKILKDNLKSRKDVYFIEETIDPSRFQEKIAESDVPIFPYHPKSYDRRISEVYLLSAMYKKLAIVSGGTWLAEQATKYSTGLIFGYDLKNVEVTIDNLNKAINEAIKNRKKYLKNIDRQAHDYQKINTARCFLDKICKRHKVIYQI